MTSIASDPSKLSDLVGEATQPDPPRIDPKTGESDVIATLHSGWTRRLGVPLVFWTVAALAGALATGEGSYELAKWAALGPGLIGFLFAITLWRRRAVIREAGVEITSIWGTRKIQYSDVETFTFDARSYRLYLPIPIGRVAVLKLKGKKGRRATFDAGFVRFDQFALFIIEKVVEASVQRMRSAIDRGDRVKFGPRIKIDRTHLYLRRWLIRTVAIPLDDVSIEVADGDFRIARTSTQKQLAMFALSGTPNLLALPQLIEELADMRQRPHPITLKNALTWSRTGT